MNRRARSLLAALVVLSGLGAAPAGAAERQVYDGGDATSDRWPDVVQVRFETVDCTGVLIAPTWVLSAAHCGDGAATVLGPRDRRDSPAWTSTSEVHVHPAYDGRTGRYDIALHRLDTPRRVHGGATLRLADDADAALWGRGERLSFAGWGATARSEHPDRLQEGDASVASDGTCRAEASEVCLQGASSPCYGDSGGPMVHDTAGERVLVALSVRASKGCRGHSVGMLVASARPWIDDLLAADTGRVAGADRYATAAALAHDWRHADTAFVVGGAAPVDALAAGPVAAAARGPILLTPRDALSPHARAALERLTPRSIVVVGGTAAVGEAVVRSLEALAPTRRIAGADRYATAAALVASGFASTRPLVFVTDGRDHVDAVATGAVAALRGAPLLVVDGARPLPDGTAKLLRRLDPELIVAVGSADALSPTVVRDLRAVAPVEAIADHALAQRTVRLLELHAPASAEVLVVARGAVADGLAAAPYATLHPRAPVVLAERTCLPRALVDHLGRTSVRSVTLLGGSAVLEDDVARRRPCAG